ncbi:MAG: tol-pal system protein YbgF [Pseudomonadota bacterium]
MSKISLVITFFFAVICGGCLTRTTNPTLPSVRPSSSSMTQDSSLAGTTSKIQDLEAEIRRIRDSLERLEHSAGERSVKELQDRISQIEKQLGADGQKTMSGSEGGSRTSATSQTPDVSGKPDAATAKKQLAATAALGQSDELTEVRNIPLTQDEKAYRTAYSTFKNGSLESAVGQFEDFLKKNPKSKFAPNAVYWIGEARLEQGRFEEAVLLFDRVIKEYPGSKKELSAQFKQGQSFDKMGDTKSAKIIFQKIVKNHPHTTHGRLAAARLKSIGLSAE